jgi:hypothetical protein
MMTHIRSFCCSAVLLLALWACTACKSHQREADKLLVPRLMIESRSVNYGSMQAVPLRLPVSGSEIAVEKAPIVNEFDILNVEMVKVDLGIALLIELSGQGARELYRRSVTNKGSRVVLVVNGNAVGARHLDRAIQDGKLYTFVEVRDEAIGQLVLDLKASIAEIQTQYQH